MAQSWSDVTLPTRQWTYQLSISASVSNWLNCLLPPSTLLWVFILAVVCVPIYPTVYGI